MGTVRVSGFVGELMMDSMRDGIVLFTVEERTSPQEKLAPERARKCECCMRAVAMVPNRIADGREKENRGG
jgi:hypothetical protein